MNIRRLAVLTVISLGLLGLGSSSVTAKSAACYSPAEFEAEQGLRIHSELMVIGLTCQRMPNARGIYGQYRQFTSQHQSLFRGYEDEMIAHFRRVGSRSPEKDFHALRTSLANSVSTQASAMRIDRFCNRYMPRLSQAIRMNRTQLRQWAAIQSSGQGTSLPLCARVARKN